MDPKSTTLCGCGCGLPVNKPGHRYRHSHRHPGPTLADRLWAKVDKNGPVPPHRPDLGACWLFTAYVGPNGRGRISPGGGRRQPIAAHRAAWLVAFGSIPDGVDVCHHCDVPRCCRPGHLFLGTRAENLADMRAKGRAEDGTRRARGTANCNARFDDETVRAIRRRAAAGETQAAIARAFGTAQPVVSRIVRGEAWRHVT